jgi:putative heme iron utilization protein
MKKRTAAQPSRESMGLMARQLLAGSFSGLLSTNSIEHKGFPFGSLIPYMLDEQLQPIILLSHLAQHYKNLQQSNKCCLTLQQRGSGDVQKLSRLTCLAEVTPLLKDEERSIERFLRYYPHQRPYYEELNFNFYRLQPTRLYFNSGFGTARWLGADTLQRHFLLKSAEEKTLLKQQANPSIIGVDNEGFDQLIGDELKRTPFAQPTLSIEQLQESL